MVRITEEQARLRGWCVPIYRAVLAAGGPLVVASAMGFKSMTAPMYWYKTGKISPKYIPGLCELTGGKVTPDEIIADLEQREGAAA